LKTRLVPLSTNQDFSAHAAALRNKRDTRQEHYQEVGGLQKELTSRQPRLSKKQRGP
jgi:hypothetical protein